MEKFIFVILHYNVIGETEKCVESIKKLTGYEDCFIVIVDNASPNNTGEALKVKYRQDKQIHVIIREKNEGFSKGNNEGCAYAIQNLEPDFLIVSNNDVEFCQRDFLFKIKEEYIAKNFSILGPDIYNPIKNNHQSPMAMNPPTKYEVNRAIIFNFLVLLLYPLAYPFMKKYYYKIENDYSVIGFDRFMEDICLHGACMIYSKNYFENRVKIFSPETVFYYEEYIQTLGCRYTGDKIIYQPNMQVFHMQGRATGTSINGLRKRIFFRTRNIVRSARIYKKYLCGLESNQ